MTGQAERSTKDTYVRTYVRNVRTYVRTLDPSIEAGAQGARVDVDRRKLRPTENLGPSKIMATLFRWTTAVVFKLFCWDRRKLWPP